MIVCVVYACVLYFRICTCSAQLSMFHVERRSRNTLISSSSSGNSSSSSSSSIIIVIMSVVLYFKEG